MALTARARIEEATAAREPRWFEDYQLVDAAGRCIVCRTALRQCAICGGERCQCATFTGDVAFVHWAAGRPVQLAAAVHDRRPRPALNHQHNLRIVMRAKLDEGATPRELASAMTDRLQRATYRCVECGSGTRHKSRCEVPT